MVCEALFYETQRVLHQCVATTDLMGVLVQKVCKWWHNLVVLATQVCKFHSNENKMEKYSAIGKVRTQTTCFL